MLAVLTEFILIVVMIELTVYGNIFFALDRFTAVIAQCLTHSGALNSMNYIVYHRIGNLFGIPLIAIRSILVLTIVCMLAFFAKAVFIIVMLHFFNAV